MTPEQDEQQDEQLAAWLDGALLPDEAEAFTAQVERDPALAKQAEAWRAHDRQIGDALGSAERPIDDALLARLGLAAAPVAANDNPRGPVLRWLAAGSALAASLAAAVMLTVGGPAPSGDPLSDALERTASLGSARLADGRTITPTLTMRAGDGRWCREFRDGTETGLACRAGGRWKVEARARAGETADPGAIAMASGADPAPLDAAYGSLKASDPLSAADESKLLSNHWK